MTKKNLTTKAKKQIVFIKLPRMVAIIMLLILGGALVFSTFVMIGTSAKLWAISSRIGELEHIAAISPAGWSTATQELYKQQTAARDALLNNPNPIISSFASSSTSWRLLYFMLSAVLGTLFSFSAIMMVLFELHQAKIKKHK